MPLGLNVGVGEPSVPSEVTLEARNICHYFLPVKARRALLVIDGVSLTIARGTFTAIVGESGCGKSTLLRIFAGLVPPSKGEVRLDGEVTRGPDPRKGMVFQEDSVFPWLTVQKNVEYGLRARGLKGDGVRAEASRWIQAVGLEDFGEAYPRELSGGMRKRVDLARVYATNPEVLLMDEPFGALDALTREALQTDLLSLWQEQRKTVVFVTHDLDEAAYLADVVVFMSPRPGRVTAILPVPLGRPRSPSVRISPEFFALTRRFREQFGHIELGGSRALAGEAGAP